MNLNKRKYKAKEVEELLEELNEEFNGKIALLKEKSDNLIEENKRLKAELDGYKDSDKIISSAIKSAENKAEEIEAKAALKYKTEIDRLSAFKEKWEGYFEYLNEKYPFYKVTKQTNNIVEMLSKVLFGELTDKGKIYKLERVLNENADNEIFNPKKKIEEYIASTEGNGIDMNQVLNPGELDLGDLCKEMGLMEKE